MKTITAILIFIISGCNFQTRTNIIDKTALPLINSFFKNIRIKGASFALDEMISSNPNIDKKDSSTIDLESKIVSINEQSGAFMGYRLLKERILVDNIGIYSYLVKYEKKFYRFIFTFYNNGNTIKLYKFLFDDDLDVELEGSLKFYTN